MPEFDIFLSHNSKDKPAVRALGEALKQKGLTVWLDEWELVPGRPWQEALEEIIETTKSAAVIVGSDGLGPWEAPEMRACISEFVDRKLPVIPVLLPGAAEQPDLPLFLKLFTWVDLREGFTVDGLDRLHWGATGTRPDGQPTVPTTDPDDISISHLPAAPEHFVGRDEELELLDKAWADSATSVISIVAFGGVGKSALVAHWLERLGDDHYCGARRVYGHSFYSQGASETSAASADEFIEKALEFFGEEASKEGVPHAGSAWDKGARLAKLVRAERTLLILDGLEPLQQPPNAGDPGIIKDPGLQALVRELAASNPGLCVISTREKVTDIPRAPEIDLEQLSDKAGAALLDALGVKGAQQECEKASAEVAGHGLALTLLGTYLARVHGGDVRKRDTITLSEVDEKRGGHAKHQIARYESWLGEGPEVSILRLLGLFDRPAEDGCIQALRAEPAIADLTDAIVDLSQSDWDEALANLRDCRLIARPEGDAAEAPLDAHPIVREYFKDQLTARFSEAAREAHGRLYEYLKESVEYQPDTLPEMMPLYHAVAHGCAAGLQQDVLDDVYFARILRGNESYSTRKLGAIGADLAAVACFFDTPWDTATEEITEADRAWIISDAGFSLRSLGRLEEAAQCMRAGMQMLIDQSSWENSAVSASNLSELHMTRGAMAEGLRSAEQGVELADRSKDAFKITSNRTTLADALHQVARHAPALAAYREAERMQAGRQPEHPMLYGPPGFRYCELLLNTTVEPAPSGSDSMAQISSRLVLSSADFMKRCHGVRERAKAALEIAKSEHQILSIGHDHLTLGRTGLLEVETRIAHEGSDLDAERDTLDTAKIHLDQSVERLREAGPQEFVARGLLVRAEHFRVREDFEEAERDLAEVESIVERAGMLLFQVDAALERCRLALARGDRDCAREALALTQELVRKTEAPYVPHVPDWDEWDPPDYVGVFEEGEIVGYHVHNDEIARLGRVLSG